MNLEIPSGLFPWVGVGLLFPSKAWGWPLCGPRRASPPAAANMARRPLSIRGIAADLLTWLAKADEGLAELEPVAQTVTLIGQGRAAVFADQLSLRDPHWHFLGREPALSHDLFGKLLVEVRNDELVNA